MRSAITIAAILAATPALAAPGLDGRLGKRVQHEANDCRHYGVPRSPRQGLGQSVEQSLQSAE